MKTLKEANLVPMERLWAGPIQFSVEGLDREIAKQIGVRREKLEQLCDWAGIRSVNVKAVTLEDKRLTCVQSTPDFTEIENAKRMHIPGVADTTIQNLKELREIAVTLEIDVDQINKWIAQQGPHCNPTEEWIKYLDQQIRSAISEKGAIHLLTPGGISTAFWGVLLIGTAMVNYPQFKHMDVDSIAYFLSVLSAMSLYDLAMLIFYKCSGYRSPIINIAGIEIDRAIILAIAISTRGAVIEQIKPKAT